MEVPERWAPAMQIAELGMGECGTAVRDKEQSASPCVKPTVQREGNSFRDRADAIIQVCAPLAE